MPRSKLGENNIRKIGKKTSGSSYSYFVTLPIEIVRKLRWIDGQKVIVELSGKKIVIKDWEPKKKA